MSIELVRFFSVPDGTFGALIVGQREWRTIERPQDDPAHPAIPVGTYPLRLAEHHTGQPDAYPCYWVDDVPGRTAIEIHIANLASQLLGCIAPGRGVGVLNGHVAVVDSTAAFNEFMAAMLGATTDILRVRDWA